MPEIPSNNSTHQSFGEYAQNVFSNVKKASVYIPGVSSLNLIANAVNSAKNNKPLTKSKSFHRSAAAFVPVLGNIALGVHDVTKYVKAQKAKGKHPESQNNTTASVSSSDIRQSAPGAKETETKPTEPAATPSGQLKIIRRPVNLKPEVAAPTSSNLTSEEIKVNNTINEIVETEKNFNTSISKLKFAINRNLGSIDQSSASGAVIISYLNELNNAEKMMLPFQKKIKDINNDKNLDPKQKMALLNEAYQSKEFKDYVSALGTMSNLYDSFNEVANKPVGTQGESLNTLFAKNYKESPSNMAIEFTQRIPRHSMLLETLEKNGSKADGYQEATSQINATLQHVNTVLTETGYKNKS